MRYLKQLLVLLALALPGPYVPGIQAEEVPTSSSVPKWIWGEEDSTTGEVTFEKEFELDILPEHASLKITADDFFVLVVNGDFILFSETWRNPRSVDVTSRLRKGKNSITVKARNLNGPAGMIAWLEAKSPSGESILVGTDQSWHTWPGHDRPERGRWQASHEIGQLGISPWKNPWSTNLAHITKPEGFVVEKLLDVASSYGSWVSICTDGNGGFFTSAEKEHGLFHVTFVDDGTAHVEKLPVELSAAHGLIFQTGVLYALVSGKGLFAIEDKDGDGQLESVRPLKEIGGRGEHGVHSIAPYSRNALMLVAGNGTQTPPGLTSKNPAVFEDTLMERVRAQSMLNRKNWVAPGGWVGLQSLQSDQLDLFASGLRNAYGITSNDQGEWFATDSDEEWDLGMPWYRPTRLYHLVSGGEYGWRGGSDKWPAYYEDVLPPIVEFGPGSPTAIVSGQGTRFPTKYQNALFALDWTYGTIRALFLEHDGATFQAHYETFVSGSPLPVTGATVADDGSLVFLTGGRGISSSLFRVRYVGDRSPASPLPAERPETLRVRRKLEAFHGVVDSDAVRAAWPYLSSNDRYLRYAARIAVESQPVESWLPYLQAEANPQGVITAAVAVGRVGDHAAASLVDEKLSQIQWASLSETQVLGLLRAKALTWSRIQPPSSQRDAAMALLPLAETSSPLIRQELLRLFAFLGSPQILDHAFDWLAEPHQRQLPDWADAKILKQNPSSAYGGTFARYLENPPPEHQLQLATFLAELSQHWTAEQAEAYFTFLSDATRYQGGAAYMDYLRAIRERALKRLPSELQAVAGNHPLPEFSIRPIKTTPPQGPGRVWAASDALSAIQDSPATTKDDLVRGRNLFHVTTCIKCHRFDGEGGAIGPDLSNVRGKFDEKALLEAIIEPSKAISDQFQSTTVLLDSGRVLTGILHESGNGHIQILSGDKIHTIAKETIEISKASGQSIMPTGLVNDLNSEELTMLVRYLLGNHDAADDHLPGELP